MPKSNAWACGVEPAYCIGSTAKVNKGVSGAVKKTHGSPQAAFACMQNYLLKQGYTKIGAKEFSPPDGGPVRVLTRKRKYGARLRPGKESGRVRAAGKRCGLVVG